MDQIEKHPRFEQAQRHARNLRGFYTHALVYILVNAGLLGLSLLASPGRYSFGFAAAGWGIGVVIHGISVFASGAWLGSEWEARKVREYLQRLG